MSTARILTNTNEAAKSLQEKGDSRRERRKEETREKIYRAAIELFSTRGFIETTTEQISNAADVGQGTFFNYFPTKPHVLLVLAEIQLRKVTLAENAIRQGASAKKTLRQLFYQILEEPGASPVLARSLLAAFITSEEVREIVARALGEGRKALGRMLTYAQQQGEVPIGKKTRQLAVSYQRTVLGTLLQWAIDPSEPLRRRAEHSFLDFWTLAVAGEQT